MFEKKIDMSVRRSDRKNKGQPPDRYGFENDDKVTEESTFKDAIDDLKLVKDNLSRTCSSNGSDDVSTIKWDPKIKDGEPSGAISAATTVTENQNNNTTIQRKIRERG